jgi:3-keto-disaccharide hydrolase
LRDFELRLKYKFVSPQGNSGIQFRSKILDQETYRVGGYQADIDATGAYDGSIYDEAGVVGGRGTSSNRGDKTTWNAENQRHAVKIADSQELRCKRFVDLVVSGLASMYPVSSVMSRKFVA